MSDDTTSIGSEMKRGAVATMLGLALGLLAAIFARKERTDGQSDGGRRWRGRSAT